MKNAFFTCFLMIINVSAWTQSYQQLHQRAIVVDTHNDFLSKSVEDKISFDENLKGRTQSDLQRMIDGGVDVQVFSIFCDDRHGKGTAFNYANLEIDSLYAVAKRNSSRMQIVSTPEQLMHAVKKHLLAAMIGVEGGHMIEDNLANLDSLFKRGARYLTLTWNNSTSWATSASDESDHAFVVSPYGLTGFGRQVVKRMNELGMMIDVSHVGEQTFWDVMANSTRPVIASHSSVYALCPVFRNLKDDQIKAIAKNGGVIQVNFYSGFLDSTFIRREVNFISQHKHEYDSLVNQKIPNYAINEFFAKKYPREAGDLRPPLSALIDHIDYIVKLVGVDYVGLGSDFDGIESAPRGLDGVEDFPLITKALLERGYSGKDIDKILGGNFIRVFKANSR